MRLKATTILPQDRPAALTLPPGWQPTPVAIEALARLLRALNRSDAILPPVPRKAVQV